MKIILTCMTMLMVVLLISCNKAEEAQARSGEVVTQDLVMNSPTEKGEVENRSKSPDDINVVADSVASPSANETVLQSGQPAPLIQWDKKIIKTANVTLEVKDYKGYNTTIHQQVAQLGGYVAGEEQSEQEGKIENNVTIKIPVARFDELLNKLSGDGVKVHEKRISSEDVTGEVVDTKARMDAKKQVRARYLDLLKQAKNMEEILRVQSEINSIQEDIEAGTGRVNYLTQQSAYSTINLKYYQYLNGTTVNDEKPGFLTKLVAAFKDGSAIISSLLLMIVTIWPFWLVALIVYLFVRKLKVPKLATPSSKQ